MFAFTKSTCSSLLSLLPISIFLSNSQGFGSQSPLLGSFQTTGLRLILSNSNSDSVAEKSFSSNNTDFIINDTRATLAKNHVITQAKFVGSTNVSSEPVAVSEDEAVTLMANFFKSKEHRNLLFPTEDCAVLKDLGAPTEAQRSQIDSISHGVFAPLAPTAQEVQCDILEIQSPGIYFAGLKVNTLNTMASQLILVCRQQERQQYEYRFVLLSSKIWAEGPTPFVWLFRKLTAWDNSNERVDELLVVPKEQTSFSFTRLWAEQAPDDNNQIMFNINATLEVRINIPKAMMRLVPMKMEKFEKQGSAVIQQLLDRDLQQSVKRLKETYLNWIADQT